ncbi:MAG: hypothetical protein DRG78_01155 [Epsilonproteobacteria bacterium]|nr:MAG: hypothetical protein DRG78_01155 [Campylobacterota bacterium]
MASKNIEKFKNIENYVFKYIKEKDIKTISFDIFDTLVHRKCDPDAILDGVSYWLGRELEKYGFHHDKDVLQARHDAYAEVMHKKADQGLDQDLILRELCPIWIKNLVDVNESDSKNIVELIMQKELELELHAIYKNIFTHSLLVKLKLMDIKVILISDMYLGIEIVEKLLDANEFTGLYDTCYVSGDVSLLKRTGRLFEYIIEKESLVPDAHLHIGDNYEADYEHAVKKGLHAIFLGDNELDYKKNINKFDYKMSKKDVNWKGYAIASYANSTPYETANFVETYAKKYFAPIYASFIHKTIERCIQEQVDKIYFLSREGFLLGMIYNELVDEVYNSHRIDEAHYLYVSRLSTYLSAMNGKIGLREIRSVADNVGVLTIKILLSPLKIESEILIKVAKRYGLNDIDEALPPFYMTWTPFINLINDEELLEIVKNKSSVYKELLLQLLEQDGFFEADKIALIDVGWGGQIQENIYTVIKDREDKPDMIGFYMATNNNAHTRKSPDNWMEWIISDKAHLSWQGLSAFDFVQSFEAISRAPHATVIGYEKDKNNKVVPKLKDEDEPSRIAESEDDILLSTMQKGIMSYIENYKYGIRLFNASAEETIPYAKTIMDLAIRFPKKEEAKILLSLRNSSDLGLNDIFSLGDNSITRLFSIKKIYDALRKSFWRYGTSALLYGHYMQILFGFNEYRRMIPKQEVSLAPGIVWNEAKKYNKKVNLHNNNNNKMLIKAKYIKQYEDNILKGNNKYKIVLKREYDKPLTFINIVPSLITYYTIKIYFKLKKGHHNLYYDGIGQKKLFARNIYKIVGHKLWFNKIIKNYK